MYSFQLLNSQLLFFISFFIYLLIDILPFAPQRLSYCIGWGIRSQIFHWVFGFLYQAAHVISLA